ncbi:GNAT superfamily N-acetyltransferase [Bacillus pakistanensis]|uniref:GNAT superfamily N-acetyltransferase n=1 Tax=Rossellomorea pakistanensis TaxID=992288 RepID=A0ABS2NJG0_9BACI|nr:GNAT family N-acetyltransferase [Bacillus pakistanensis]MBM7587997.1 GNAT superfamily N-acetyltransferase [Bacillus pakistanensis]
MFKVKQLDGSDFMFDEIAFLYNDIWNKEGTDFLGRLKRHSNYEGFRGFVAFNQEKEMIGYSYGYTSLEGQYYRDLLAKQLNPHELEAWLENCFEVVELAVHPSIRRSGLGQLLVGKLLEGVEHKTAILTTQEKNIPARTLYQNLEWVVVKESFIPSSVDATPYVIMGKSLVVSRK